MYSLMSLIDNSLRHWNLKPSPHRPQICLVLVDRITPLLFGQETGLCAQLTSINTWIWIRLHANISTHLSLSLIFTVLCRLLRFVARLSASGLQKDAQSTRKCDFTSSLRGCVKTETHSGSVTRNLSLLFIRSQSYFTDSDNYETFTHPSSHNATGSQTPRVLLEKAPRRVTPRVSFHI